MPCGCYPGRSSWIRWICVVNGVLTLVFSDGSTAQFPGLGAAAQQQLLFAASQGQLVNALKGWPYQKVPMPAALIGRLPAVTQNCPDGVCPRLRATVTVEYVDRTFTLNFTLIESNGVWAGTAACNGSNELLEVWDPGPGSFQWKLSGFPQSNLPVGSCDPFDAGGLAGMNGIICNYVPGPAGPGAAITIIVTE